MVRLGFGGFRVILPGGSIDAQTCERQLDRVQSFHPRIDAKVTALFAITAGQIAVAMANLKPDDLETWWISWPLLFFAAFAVFVFVQLYRCSFPQLAGGEGSMVYFDEIAKLKSDEYSSKFGVLTHDELKADLICQIWRNAEIVAMKYRRLKRATTAAMLSVAPWAIFLMATSIQHWETPKFAG